jgi:hypothetical protein
MLNLEVITLLNMHTYVPTNFFYAFPSVHEDSYHSVRVWVYTTRASCTGKYLKPLLNNRNQSQSHIDQLNYKPFNIKQIRTALQSMYKQIPNSNNTYNNSQQIATQ